MKVSMISTAANGYNLIKEKIIELIIKRFIRLTVTVVTLGWVKYLYFLEVSRWIYKIFVAAIDQNLLKIQY
ncbi:hypothetical protein [Halanaerobium congolense]|jgi:hypothetical protein|uniref:hypothetical protein n=1 Tax=Halanaerobium congolense TaxID=54121 RepID=UPI00106153ED|nr:hypothetical protein [Halanaerobium congolense]